MPGLSQVPLATPQPQLPRWALAVIGVLVAAVLVLGGAWWQSTRAPAEVAAPAPTVERSVELPPPSPSRRRDVPHHSGRTVAAARAGSARAVARERGRAGDAPTRAENRRARARGAAASVDSPSAHPRCRARPRSPPKASRCPTLRLELHAFSAQPRERFVFINGRKYVEGERLAEGPQLVVDRADGRRARRTPGGGSCSFRSERGSALARVGDGRDQASRRRCAGR